MPWAGRRQVKKLKAWLPTLAAFILMLLSFIITPPTGEMIVSLEWNGLAMIFVMTLTVAGIRKEKMIEAIGRSASVFTHLGSTAAFFVVIAFILSPFITALFAAPALTALASAILKRKERSELVPSFAAMITAAATAGGMFLPAGSIGNMIYHRSIEAPFITTMGPLVIASIPVLALMIPIMLGKRTVEKTYITDESTPPSGNKGLRMFYACFAFIITLTSFSLFSWPDILFFSVIIILLFDRKVFVQADYRFILSALFLSIAGKCLEPFLVPFFAEGSYWKTVVLGELIGQFPASAITLYQNADHGLLLRALNASSFGTLSSLPALFVLLSLKKEERKAFLIRYTIIAIVMLLMLMAVTMALAH